MYRRHVLFAGEDHLFAEEDRFESGIRGEDGPRAPYRLHAATPFRPLSRHPAHHPRLRSSPARHRGHVQRDPQGRGHDVWPVQHPYKPRTTRAPANRPGRTTSPRYGRRTWSATHPPAHADAVTQHQIPDETAPSRTPATHRLTLRFSSTRRGARLARRLAVQQFTEWTGLPHDAEPARTLALVTAELASNAIRHGSLPGRDFLPFSMQASCPTGLADGNPIRGSGVRGPADGRRCAVAARDERAVTRVGDWLERTCSGQPTESSVSRGRHQGADDDALRDQCVAGAVFRRASMSFAENLPRRGSGGRQTSTSGCRTPTTADTSARHRRIGTVCDAEVAAPRATPTEAGTAR